MELIKDITPLSRDVYRNIPQKMVLAWEKKVRLTHLYFTLEMLLEHLQMKKHNALQLIQNLNLHHVL